MFFAKPAAHDFSNAARIGQYDVILSKQCDRIFPRSFNSSRSVKQGMDPWQLEPDVVSHASGKAMAVIPDQLDEDEKIEIEPTVITDNERPSGLGYIVNPADFRTMHDLSRAPKSYESSGFFRIEIVLHNCRDTSDGM
jgi:hypothetical protein